MPGLKFQERVHIDANVAAGNQIPINLPVGTTYELLVLELTNLAKDEIRNIRININGNLVSQYKDAVQMEKIQKYYGKKVQADKLFFHFLDRTFDDPKYQAALALGTAGEYVTTVDVTFDIKDEIASANAPKIVASAVKSAGTTPGALAKVRAFPLSVSAGVTEFPDITRPDGARIKAIHVLKEEDDVKHVELEVDKKNYIENSKASLQAIQESFDRAPQAGMYTLDFALQGDMYEMFKIPSRMVQTENGLVQNPYYIQDLRLRMDCETAGQVFIVVEYVDVWNPTGF